MKFPTTSNLTSLIKKEGKGYFLYSCNIYPGLIGSSPMVPVTGH